MNLAIEQSIQSWLIQKISPFTNAVIHCGQSDEEIKNDQQMLVVSCEETQMQSPTLYIATVRLIISTPCINGNLEEHRALYNILRLQLKNADPITSFFPSYLECINASIVSIAESQSNQKWLSSITIAFGIEEI
jgi:hypothetical protein